VLSLDGVDATSIRMSDALFFKRNQQGKFQQMGLSDDSSSYADGRHWGEL